MNETAGPALLKVAATTTAVMYVHPTVEDSTGKIVGAVFGGVVLGSILTCAALFIFIKVRRYRITREMEPDTPEMDVLLTVHRRKEEEQKMLPVQIKERMYTDNPEVTGLKSTVDKAKTATLGYYTVMGNPDHATHCAPNVEPEYVEPRSDAVPLTLIEGADNSQGKSGPRLPPAVPPRPGKTSVDEQPSYENLQSDLQEQLQSQSGDLQTNDDTISTGSEDHVYEPIDLHDRVG